LARCANGRRVGEARLVAEEGELEEVHRGDGGENVPVSRRRSKQPEQREDAASVEPLGGIGVERVGRRDGVDDDGELHSCEHAEPHLQQRGRLASGGVECIGSRGIRGAVVVVAAVWVGGGCVADNCVCVCVGWR